MSAQDLFRKALIQLDLGRHDAAEMNLRSAIDEAEIEGDQNTGISGKYCLGELLYRLGRFEQARPLLNEIANLNRTDDVFDREQHSATDLLFEMDNPK